MNKTTTTLVVATLLFVGISSVVLVDKIVNFNENQTPEQVSIAFYTLLQDAKNFDNIIDNFLAVDDMTFDERKALKMRLSMLQEVIFRKEVTKITSEVRGAVSENTTTQNTLYFKDGQTLQRELVLQKQPGSSTWLIR